MTERPPSIEGRGSWVAAGVVLAILSISYGSPLLIVVGMKPIQEALGTDRSVIALAGSLIWVGTGLGGIPMGWLADRIGIRRTVAIGALMMTAGLALSTLGGLFPLYVGHGLLIGLIGNGAIYAPLLIYVSRWFDRRRGTAIALISSGQTDFVRPIYRRSRLARDIRARDRLLWLAGDDVRLRRGGRRLHPAHAAAVTASAGAAERRARDLRGGARTAGTGHETRPGTGPDLCRRILLPHPDGDPQFASGGVPRRSGDQPGPWRGDAVSVVGVRLHLPSVLGRARRPDRRIADGDVRLDLPGGFRSRPFC